MNERPAATAPADSPLVAQLIELAKHLEVANKRHLRTVLHDAALLSNQRGTDAARHCQVNHPSELFPELVDSGKCRCAAAQTTLVLHTGVAL